MNIPSVTLAEAKARLSELTERAAAGEEWVITKHGRPIGRLCRLAPEKQPVDVERLRQLTSGMRTPPYVDDDTVRRMRETARY